MTCPYCGKEMISGVVMADVGYLSWLPEPSPFYRKPSATKPAEKLMDNEYQDFLPCYVNCWRCRPCKIIMIKR